MRPFVARILLLLGLTLALMTATSPVRAEVYLVVHTASPIKTLTRKQVVDLFTGRTRAFPNGDFALLFDLPRDSGQRAQFYRILTGMSLAQINSYWSRLMFSGQNMPPQPLSSEQAVIESLRRNAGALGYLTVAPTDPGLRTVLVLESPAP